jgi:hypothetical protein
MKRFGMLIAILGGLLTMLGTLHPALAHSHRTLADKYDVEVGWDKEPAVVNQPNAATIRITQKGTSDPVNGVDSTLTVKVAFGGNTPTQLKLRASDDQPGYYLADLIPTRVGDYVFTFSGKIEATAVNDEKFESGPDSFDAVIAPDGLQIPSGVADSTSASLQAAQDAANTARAFALIGIGVGIVGIVIGIAAFLKR